jgi:hypothetical protein
VTLQELLDCVSTKLDDHLAPSIQELETDLRHCPGDLTPQQKIDAVTAYRRALAQARECVLGELISKLQDEGMI